MTRIQHSSPKKNCLIGSIQSGKTIADAAEIAEIPYGTAKKILAKYCATGSTSNCPRSGRPSKVDDRVPYLKKEQKMKRLEWAKQNRGIKWDRVVWSDECYVHLDDLRGRIYVTRTADEEYEDNCLIPTFKQSSVRVMVWDAL
ncbi:hypothetical protein BT96DRAFT_949959 [Gymnopus androsaceus JB14]|uniref:Transposase Tc1-like domain-containing protein n=1 Tax=Gymnopus androsaceus JB14 TaxID=1447944 RepID=A0A6A4GIF2_9AGAR|nr:hypothetical protein BT96DRAFT_949959 [Gymnopus androsaceus JB14]